MATDKEIADALKRNSDGRRGKFVDDGVGLVINGVVFTGEEDTPDDTASAKPKG